MLPASNFVSSWTFNGSKDNYNVFREHFYQELSKQQIVYILNTERVQQLATQPPDLEIPHDAPYNIKSKYDRDWKHHERNKEKLYNDFNTAIGILTSLVSPTIRTRLQVFIHTNEEPRLRFNNCFNFIENSYAPINENDANIIMRRLQTATDEHGYRKLLDIHFKSQAELSAIQKRNAQGILIYDNNDIPLSHKLSSQALRSILLEQIGKNGNIHFEAIRREAILHDHIYTYEKIIECMERLLREPLIYDPLSSDNSTTDHDITNKRVLIASTSATASNNQSHTFHGNMRVQCLNCRKQGHYVSQCPDTMCYKCKLRFNSLEDRRFHSQQVHSRYNNNNSSSTVEGNTNKRSYDSTHKNNSTYTGYNHKRIKAAVLSFSAEDMNYCKEFITTIQSNTPTNTNNNTNHPCQEPDDHQHNVSDTSNIQHINNDDDTLYDNNEEI